MAKPLTSSPPRLHLITFSLLLLFLLPQATAHAAGPEGMAMAQIDFVLGRAMGKTNQCKGSMAECLESNEFEMGSESTRRILAVTQYISYGALQANRVPCSQRGASYYNCVPGASANPYRRGCSAITRCRR